MCSLWTCVLLIIQLSCTVNGAGGDDKGPSLQQVTDPVLHAEGPHWDPIQQSLYYVDIFGQTVTKYDPTTGYVTRTYIEGGPISPVVTVEGTWDEFVAGRGRELIWFRWDGSSSSPNETRVLTEVDIGEDRNRFNDGKADAVGRMWAGTMAEGNPQTNLGSFYSFDYKDDFTPVTQLSEVTISNGLAWTDNDTLMYYIDSGTKQVDVFDFNIDEGTIGNRRKVFNTSEHGFQGDPDGMAIDSDGNIWVAVFGGWSVLKIDPTNGKLLQTVELPAAQVSSCAFGGPNLDILYITTSRSGLSDQQLQEQPRAGAVFALSGIGVTGQLKPNTIRLY